MLLTVVSNRCHKIQFLPHRKYAHCVAVTKSNKSYESYKHCLWEKNKVFNVKTDCTYGNDFVTDFVSSVSFLICSRWFVSLLTPSTAKIREVCSLLPDQGVIPKIL
jgi:hypothetical protein